MTSRTFAIHGVYVSVAAQDQEVVHALERRLRHFVSPDAGPTQLMFEFARADAVREHHLPVAPHSARSVYDSPLGEVRYAAESDHLFIDAGPDVRVVADCRTGRVRTSVHGTVEQQLWLLTHPLFTLPLIELLKRHGRYSLHAAGLALDGHGLLLAGSTGSGKSTLAVALLRRGFDFLGDDMLFLQPTPEGVRALAFPDEIDLTESTISLFADLAWISQRPRPRGWPKWSLTAGELCATRTALTCRPSVLIFPRVGSAPGSTLEPMGAQDALLELAPNVLLTEGPSSAAHFAALAQLVRTCSAYRLNTGRDFDEVARVLRGLLGQ